jgi:rubrerythrin
MSKKRARADDELLDSLDDFLCSICMDVQDDPSELPCSHTFCKACITLHLAASKDRKCPVCMASADGAPRTTSDIERRRRLRARCACGETFPLLKFRAHTEMCTVHATEAAEEAARVAQHLPHGRAPPPPAPNRATFKCPFCEMPHFPRADLLNHLRSVHARDGMRPAVCPVCAAMPWGDPNYTSPNLLQHFEMRHRFDYETTTDYSQEEDDVLQQVLALSRRER